MFCVIVGVTNFQGRPVRALGSWPCHWLKVILFADDTNLLFSHESVLELVCIVNQELQLLEDWFRANRLSLNIDKTNYVAFHTVDYIQNKIHINNKIITQSTVTKFLCIYMDEGLTWTQHINSTANKVAKNV